MRPTGIERNAWHGWIIIKRFQRSTAGVSFALYQKYVYGLCGLWKLIRCFDGECGCVLGWKRIYSDKALLNLDRKNWKSGNKYDYTIFMKFYCQLLLMKSLFHIHESVCGDMLMRQFISLANLGREYSIPQLNYLVFECSETTFVNNLWYILMKGDISTHSIRTSALCIVKLNIPNTYIHLLSIFICI